MAATEEKIAIVKEGSSVNFGAEEPAAETTAETTKDKGKAKKIKSKIDRFLLKFPKISAAFKELKNSFKTHGTKIESTSSEGNVAVKKVDLSVSPENLGALLGAIGIGATSEGVAKLFESSDFDGNKLIEFRECLIAAGLAILKSEKYGVTLDTENKSYKVLKNGYGVIQDMWNCIVPEEENFIHYNDLAAAFGITEKQMENDPELVMRRMKELDFDTNAEVEFHEFIYGVAAWVGFDDDEEEEEN